jgi:hypothetical protein
MIIQMNDSKINTIEEVKEFLKSSEKVEFTITNQQEAYDWTKKVLIKFGYLGRLTKKEKGVLKRYIKHITGYSRAQVTRLIRQYRKQGYIKNRQQRRNTFSKKYTDKDIHLLAYTDRIHKYPNGAALKNILKRMYTVFRDNNYKNLSNISVSHIYNIRNNDYYKRINCTYIKTKPSVARAIGERRKPDPQGKPGYLRVDTVHQGDKDGMKGIYHINTIDEVTQFQCIGAVPQISEHFLVPVVKNIVESYPFTIVEFHSDNGSEFINKVVCALLNKMLIKQTKSRARKTNDNALVESKNGSIIRKWIGYGFISKEYAGNVNTFYSLFNEYLNFHRSCGFAQELTDKKGKIKKVYNKNDYMTPYEKFKSLPHCEEYLKKGVTLKLLDNFAVRYTDNSIAEVIQDNLKNLTKEVVPDHYLSLCYA